MASAGVRMNQRIPCACSAGDSGMVVAECVVRRSAPAEKPGVDFTGSQTAVAHQDFPDAQDGVPGVQADAPVTAITSQRKRLAGTPTAAAHMWVQVLPETMAWIVPVRTPYCLASSVRVGPPTV